MVLMALQLLQVDLAKEKEVMSLFLIICPPPSSSHHFTVGRATGDGGGQEKKKVRKFYLMVDGKVFNVSTNGLVVVALRSSAWA